MSTRRFKFVVKRPAVVDVGCRWRRRSKLSFFSPLPKAKLQSTHSLILSPSSTTTTTGESSHTSASSTATATAAATAAANSSSSSSPSCFADYTSSSQSPELFPTESPETKKETKGTVAVVVESSDPYADFRDSMLQMVLETEICTWEDLCELLHRFLALNAPRHHHVIIHAFAEVYRVIFSPSDGEAAASTSASAAPSHRAVTAPEGLHAGIEKDEEGRELRSCHHLDSCHL